MPRKPWKVRATVPQISESLRVYLETGECEHPTVEIFMLRKGGDRLRDVWRKVRREILATWTTEHPCTRPWPWWTCEAKDPRRRLGGVGVPQSETIAVAPCLDLGIPSSWFDQADAKLFGGTAVDEADPPTFESEAAYLQRHGLLSAAEQKWLADHPEALQPEAVRFEDDDE